jgi:lysophospholipase L1-like esterase
MTRAIGIFIIVIVVLYLVYTAFTISQKFALSLVLIEQAHVFENISSDTTKPLLVLGDSTAVGVGAAKPEDSIAGLTSTYINATYVENYAVSGATTSDVFSQLEHAKLSTYDTILLQVGGNDIIRFHDVATTAKELSNLLQQLPESKHVYITSVGNVGDATFFPFFIRPFHDSLNIKYHTAFAKIAKQHGATYINLNQQSQTARFIAEPKTYYASDGLHPSSDGYRLWFEIISPFLKP